MYTLLSIQRLRSVLRSPPCITLDGRTRACMRYPYKNSYAVSNCQSDNDEIPFRLILWLIFPWTGFPFVKSELDQFFPVPLIIHGRVAGKYNGAALHLEPYSSFYSSSKRNGLNAISNTFNEISVDICISRWLSIKSVSLSSFQIIW